MPRRWRWLVPMTALIACALPRAGASAAPQETDVPIPPVEDRVESPAHAATVRALADRTRRTTANAPARPTSVKSDGVVKTAVAQIGDGYAWGGSGPDAFDCSGPDRVRLRQRRRGAATHLAGPGGDGPSRRPRRHPPRRPRVLQHRRPGRVARRHRDQRHHRGLRDQRRCDGALDGDAYWGGHYVGARRVL